MQQHMAQQAAFSQIPDDVKGVRLNIFSFVSVLIITFALLLLPIYPVHRTFSSSRPGQQLG